MRFKRAAGILLHPSSLPGPYGIGHIGQSATRFLEFLKKASVSLWQILPLGPTGYGNSPYQSLSAFAGNSLLISFSGLIDDGLLDRHEVESGPGGGAPTRVDFGRLIPFAEQILQRAYENFRQRRNPALLELFDTFREENRNWLPEYTLFRAIKGSLGNAAWIDWPQDLVRRDETALRNRREKLSPEIDYIAFKQFLFFRQWRMLKTRANEMGIQIIGDVPIFVAHDSADVWANQHEYRLDADGMPQYVAGVPPDYFSATGQLWGNPLYRWDVMAASGYAWWMQRFESLLSLVDIIRLDHFRGFEAYWEVPAVEQTAMHGTWQKGPGEAFFRTLEAKLGTLPIIAEDLGVITPEVEAIRDLFDFPGMKILQYAFDTLDGTNEYMPHNYTRNCVVYTGTHDNETSRGWFMSGAVRTPAVSPDDFDEEHQFALKYLNGRIEHIHWDFIRAAFASVADLAIVPLQDALGLDNAGRMNVPSRPDGNWEWRFREEDLSDACAERLAELVWLYGRT